MSYAEGKAGFWIGIIFLKAIHVSHITSLQFNSIRFDSIHTSLQSLSKHQPTGTPLSTNLPKNVKRHGDRHTLFNSPHVRGHIVLKKGQIKPLHFQEMLRFKKKKGTRLSNHLPPFFRISGYVIQWKKSRPLNLLTPFLGGNSLILSFGKVWWLDC